MDDQQTADPWKDAMAPERDDDIPEDVRRGLMRCATHNGRISYWFLCDVYRRGRAQTDAAYRKREQKLLSDVAMWREAYEATDHAQEQRAWQFERDRMVEWRQQTEAELAEARRSVETLQAEVEAARELIRRDAAFQEWAQGYLDSGRWAGHDRSDAIKAELLERDQQVETLTRERDAFWQMVECGWEIEPRDYFEKEAPAMGYGSPMAMAAHHMWKRDPKVAAVEQERDQLREALTALKALRLRILYEMCPDCDAGCDHGAPYDAMIKMVEAALSAPPAASQGPTTKKPGTHPKGCTCLDGGCIAGLPPAASQEDVK